MSKPIKQLLLLSLALGFMGLAGPSLAKKDELPDVTTDGLKRVDTKTVDALYVQDGATLAPYKRVYLVDCFVSFRKDWQRDYNRDERDLERQVRDSDMKRIQTAMAEEFKKEFTKQLEAGGYEITTDLASDVLIVRPAIVNLDPTAPDLRTAGMSATIVQSAGAMTLYAELYDGGTNAKIAQVVDGQTDPDGFAQRANRVTNTSAADRILRHWAGQLVKGLDEAKATTGN